MKSVSSTTYHQPVNTDELVREHVPERDSYSDGQADPSLGIIKIKNLRLRSLVGINQWEREKKQDIIINIKVGFAAQKAAMSDKIDDTVNYKVITKKIIEEVEHNSYGLLEKLAQTIINIVMEDSKVIWTKVKVDKPFALRFSDSVSVKLRAHR